MPLLDHFHPPLGDERSWEGFHSEWAGVIVHHLNDAVLPSHFFAEPRIHWGTTIEVDIGTIEKRREATSETSGGTATAVWAPPQALLSLDIDGLDPDVVEVRITQRRGGLRLAAAIELISPANKDREESRQAFVSKCVAYLQGGVGVVIIDVVTNRLSNLHEALLDELGGHPTSSNGNGHSSTDPTLGRPLYAVSYRATRLGGTAARLKAWPSLLAVGVPLPTLPLWLDRDLCVPLDLETTYLTTCRALRIDPE